MRRDFDKELKTALCYAMELEYAKYPVPKELEYEYPFSDAFEKKMKTAAGDGCIFNCSTTFCNDRRRHCRTEAVCKME